MSDTIWPAQPGTYMLLFSFGQPTRLSVGRLGMRLLPAGDYAYLGTARGPGGLRARISRHLHSEKNAHWHVDYLTQLAPPVDVIAVPTSENLECRWVHSLLDLAGTCAPIPGFGSSDCQADCPAHLIRLPDSIHLHLIKEMLL